MSGELLVRLTYTPDYADTFAVQRQANRYHYSAGQRHIWWLLIPISLLMFFATTQLEAPIRAVVRPFVWPGFVFWAPLAFLLTAQAALWWFVCRWLVPRMSAKWMEQRSRPVPVDFEAGPERLSWQSADTGWWVHWSAIERLFVTPTAVCLLVRDRTAFVPLSALPDAGTRKALVELMLARMPEEARALSLADTSVKAVLAEPTT